MSEIKGMIERIDANCKTLYDGWREQVEYKVPVMYHGACEDRNNPACGCPTVDEVRVRQVKRPGLLEQLKEYTSNKDADLNPKAARGAPRVKTPKMHPELAGCLTLDEITCDAYTLLDKIFEEAGRDRLWLAQPLKAILQGLHYQVSQFAGERPDLARDVMKATDRWVAKAKASLKLTVSEAMFGDTVCGNCNGGLAVAWDNSSDVRCIGTPAAPPCGTSYPMSEWVALYERGRK